MRRIPILCTMLAAAAAAHGADTAWSQPSAIDLTGGNARRVAPAAVAYSPDYVPGGDAAFGKVELLDIQHYGTFSPTTNTLVSTSAAAAIGAATLTGAGAHHLVLRAFDANDALVGSISADVGLGVASPFAAETLADMADEKLDRLIQTGATPQLAYSSAWVEGTTSVAIDVALEKGSVKPLFSSSAPADGTCEFIPAGEKRTRNAVRLHFYDSGENEICDPLVAYYSGIGDFATLMIWR